MAFTHRAGTGHQNTSMRLFRDDISTQLLARTPSRNAGRARKLFAAGIDRRAVERICGKGGDGDEDENSRRERDDVAIRQQAIDEPLQP
ncbi:MAG TPA: hypothetical protein VJR30_07220 [Bradyrhizobium sp.]|nr:hypothetical protein [Bradyrhizobium sp.]